MTSLFVSHSSADREAAQLAIDRLRQLGFTAVFLDTDPEQGIQAGQRWEHALYTALRRTDAVVFLVTEAAIASRWCFAELALARSLGRPIFPGRLSGTARHQLIADTQEVDLRHEGGFHRLAAALRIAGLDPDRAFGWDATRSPFPGLSAFTADDAAVFFGRQQEIGRLLDLLQPTLGRAPGRWVSIVGPSGSGKSSLLRAGLLPRLARMPDQWLVVPAFIPGTDPLRRLTLALTTSLAQHGPLISADEVQQRLTDPSTGISALLEYIGSLREAAGGPANVLIVIDQLEELITRAGTHEQADFLRLLDDALSREGALWVVATLRSEFLGTSPERAGLVEIIDDALVLEPLSRARLPEVITRPAARAGLDFEPGLVERMVEETAGGDALPLLAYTLHELADRADRVISHSDYEAVGGVVGALRSRADRLVDDLTRHGHGPLIVPTLMKLASLDTEGVPVRRRLPRAALSEGEAAVIDAFVHARLLTSTGSDPRGAGGPPTVEVAHEALLRQWEPLDRAIQGSRDSLRIRTQLGRVTADWQSSGHDASYLLRGNRLALFEEWAEDNPGDVQPLEREFVTASQAADAKVKGADRRSYRRLRLLAAGLSVMLIVSLVAIALAVQRGRLAALEADLASARQLLAQADQAWSGQPDVSLLLNAEALRRIPDGGLDEARYALVSRLNQPLHVATPLIGHSGEVDKVVFTPDGRVLATAGQDGTVRFWAAADGRSLGQLPLAEPRPVQSIAISPDGSTLAVVSGPTTRLWDIATRQPRGEPLVGHTKDVVKAIFSPDSRLVATISDDTTIRLWDAASGQPHGHPLTGHTATVFDAAFTPDGSTLISAAFDHRVRLWDVQSGRPGPVLLGHKDAVTAVAISADGTTLASSGDDGTVRLWNLPTGVLRHVLSGHVGPVSSLAISPDGTTVASGDDRLVRLWSTATGALLGTPMAGHTDVVIALRYAGPHILVSGSVDGTLRIWDVDNVQAMGGPLTGHTSWITDLAVSPDRTLLASASGDGTARLWRAAETRLLGRALPNGGPGPFNDVAVDATGTAAAAGSDGAVHLWDVRTLAPAGRLTGHHGKVMAVAFGPDGILASGGEDTTIRLWDVAGQRPVGPPLTAGDAVLGLAFSADGRMLASAGANGSVRLWDVASRRLLGVLPGHEHNVNTVAFGPPGMLASGGDDMTLRLWDTATMRPIGGPIATKGTVRDVAFSPDGSLIAAGGSDAEISFWDTATRQPRGDPLVGFKNWVNGIAFSPDGKTLAVAADHYGFQLWDIATSRADGDPLIATGERVFAAAFSPDGSVLAAASESATALWNIQDHALLSFACQLANRNLTDIEWKRYFGPAVPYSETCPR